MVVEVDWEDEVVAFEDVLARARREEEEDVEEEESEC